MEIEIWWIWMGFAAIFLIAEIMTAGFFLLWFSFGAAAAGILALLKVGPPGQLTVFILVSGILFVFGRRFADRVSVNQPPGIGADRFTDQIGVVIDEINVLNNTGSVRMGQEEWRANSETGEVIPKGTRVRVMRVDGTHAIVKTITEE